MFRRRSGIRLAKKAGLKNGCGGRPNGISTTAVHIAGEQPLNVRPTSWEEEIQYARLVGAPRCRALPRSTRALHRG
ncbi:MULTISPECIES: hypothetical protein [Selenomonas]|uniref:hypothetical protein n=1 Tax=Selenomonas TaxID=970 RepID=UPI0001EB25DC|nr:MULTISPECIES: hypothetical protein [Selenomonas]EFR41843.1 hypothetical protein HMPREF9162_0173 [Selenomonas sp. oral taxon 137 str. F0430]